MLRKPAVLATLAFAATLLGPWMSVSHSQSRGRAVPRSTGYRGRSVRTPPHRGYSPRSTHRGGSYNRGGSFYRGRSYNRGGSFYRGGSYYRGTSFYRGGSFYRRPYYGRYRSYRPSYRHGVYYRPYYRPHVSWGIGWGSPGWGYWGAPAFGVSVGGYVGSVSYYSGGATQYSYQNGSVQLKVQPKTAEVWVDGYYAGIVDDFDGSFQRLYIPPGQHDIEIRMEGYRTHQLSLHVNSGQTTKIHHNLDLLGPGAATPSTPEPVKPPETEPPAPPAEQEKPVRNVEPQRPRPDEPRPPAGRRSSTPSWFGMLAVRVQPGEATIIIDGEPWGTSAGFEELTIHLRTGRHTVELRSQGYEPFVTDVEIKEGQTTPLNVRLNGGARS